MELAGLEEGVVHTSWNYSGERLGVGTEDGSVQIWDRDISGNTSFSCTSKWETQDGPVLKVVWAPPEFGDVVVSSSMHGGVSVWEEIKEGDEQYKWRLCAQFKERCSPVLDLQFGNCSSGLKLVAAGADGHIKIYEMTDTLELKHWQLQAEFSNVAELKEGKWTASCSSASVSWRPPADAIQRPVFVLGYCSTSPQFNTAKVWEFAEAHQRWQLLAELVEPDEESEAVNHVSWAPNVGRPYELIAVASESAVSIWRIEFPSHLQGKPAVSRVARLTEHKGEVWQVAWDMAGMTLATSGSDGNVRLWQAGFGGQWQQQGIVDSVSSDEL